MTDIDLSALAAARDYLAGEHGAGQYRCHGGPVTGPRRRSSSRSARFWTPLVQPLADALGERARGGVRLDQELVGAELDTAVDQLPVTVVAEDDHRDRGAVRVLPKRLEHLETVLLGKPHIEEDDVREQLLGPRQAVLAIDGDMHPVAVQGELHPVHLQHRRIVLDEKDVDDLVVHSNLPDDGRAKPSRTAAAV
jgi:hypothetical protein